MTVSRGDDLELLLERYLAEQMPPLERDAFERRLEDDPSLRAQVELQRRIDGGLRRMFAPPDSAQIAAPDGEATPDRTVRDGGAIDQDAKAAGATPPRRQWKAALAAAVLLAVSAGILWTYFGPARPRAISAPETIAANVFVERVERAGYQPDWVCTTEEEFIRAFDYVGDPVLVDASDGLEVIGWVYSGERFGVPIADSTLGLLTRLGDDRVVVLVENEAVTRRPFVETDSGFRIFERAIGNVRFYEVTRLAEPEVLPRLRPAAEDGESGGAALQDS